MVRPTTYPLTHPCLDLEERTRSNRPQGSLQFLRERGKTVRLLR